MTCTVLSNGVTVCTPGGILIRRVRHCWECDRTHRFVERQEVWYGPTLYGLCGDTWSEGYRMTRPFRRGWRANAVRHARALWDRAVSPAEGRAALLAEFEEYRPVEDIPLPTGAQP